VRSSTAGEKAWSNSSVGKETEDGKQRCEGDGTDR